MEMEGRSIRRSAAALRLHNLIKRKDVTMVLFVMTALLVLMLIAYPRSHSAKNKSEGQKVLVAGGAGYVGSHAVKQLVREGYWVIVVDSFGKNGHHEAIKRIKASAKKGQIKVYKRDLKNMGSGKESLDSVFKRNPDIDIVMQFCDLHESDVVDPAPFLFYKNNVRGTINLIETMQKHDVKKFVFSSSAAVYGAGKKGRVMETDTADPIGPYGESKKVIERMLHWTEEATGLQSVILRHFSVAGADSDGVLGEEHVPETHLIPTALKVALGQQERVFVHGVDYATGDGSAVRDFVHVDDVAMAFVKAANYLLSNETSSLVLNVGSGVATSVRQVIDTCRKVSKSNIPSLPVERRPHDATEMVASIERIKNVFGWHPEKSAIETIVRDAWTWHQSNPHGYSKS